RPAEGRVDALGRDDHAPGELVLLREAALPELDGDRVGQRRQAVEQHDLVRRHGAILRAQRPVAEPAGSCQCGDMSSEITPPHPTGPGTFAEGDSNQLEAQETLDDRGVDDTLDEGYTPPERDRPNHYGETDWEQSAGEPFDRR